MNHPLRCRCGTLKGQVSHARRAMRLVCYCKDCQAFAHFLGRPGEVLDGMGGTDIVATRPAFVSFSEGTDALACMSLSPKGLLRWYASCCNTPIGNTSRDFKVAHVGLIHSCLADRSHPLGSSFGPVRMRAGIRSARGKPPSTAIGSAFSIARLLAALARARLNGSYRLTPFFGPQGGAPVVAPKVLTLEEREQLMSAV